MARVDRVRRREGIPLALRHRHQVYISQGGAEDRRDGRANAVCRLAGSAHRLHVQHQCLFH